jgi:ABC-type transport system involved in multi-copper enzyme maturation permease subunit
MSIVKVIRTELLKLRRSPIVPLSFALYAFFALISWFVLWIVKNPEAAAGLGLVGQKAGFAANGLGADWRGLFTFVSEMNVMGGAIVLSFIVIYLFGREYVELCAKNMLALPVPRRLFVETKLIVAAAWFILLTALLLAETLAVGALLGLGTPDAGTQVKEGAGILLAAFLSVALQGLVAWVTVASRGYLAPFGYTMATLIVGSLMARTDWAPWCPWSITAAMSGLTGPRRQGESLGGFIILAATFALGFALTLLHEEKADNCQ